VNRKPFSIFKPFGVVLFSVLLLGVLLQPAMLFLLGAYGFAADAARYRFKPLQSHRLVIAETDVQKVRLGMYRVFKDRFGYQNGIKTLSSFHSPRKLRIGIDAYYDRTSQFKISLRAQCDDDLRNLQARIAVYPARVGSKEYDDMKDQFKIIMDGLVESGLFQLQPSSFDEDYLDPLSVTHPSCR